MGGIIRDTVDIIQNGEQIKYSATLGRRTEQNPYAAELVAIAAAVGRLPADLMGRQIAVFSSNQVALLALSQPRQQSGQSSIGEVYNVVRVLKRRGNLVRLVWLPFNADFEPSRKAKEAARQAVEQRQLPLDKLPCMKSTTINFARAV